MLSRYLSKRVNRVVACAIAAGFVGLMLLSSATAQSWNKNTRVTFSEPIEIPGVGARRIDTRYSRNETHSSDPQFECVLPYVSGGAEIDVLNSGGESQNLYALIDLPPHQWGWNIAIPSNSSFKWNETNQEDFVIPVLDGGPIYFTSDRPIVAYTVLSSPNTTAVSCSNPQTVKKLFRGDRNSGIVLVNVSELTIPVLIYKDRSPVYFLTLAPNERMIAFLTDLFRINDDSDHEVMITTGGAGVGLFALTYKNGLAVSLPLSESN